MDINPELQNRELLKELMEKDGAIMKPAVFPKAIENRKISGVTVNDGMSPYTFHPPKLRFNNISDYINEKGFHAFYPESYTPLSSYFVVNNVEPFCQTEYEDEIAHGMITIAGLIELTTLGKPWALYDINDLPIIKEATSRYYRQLRDIPTSNKTQDLKVYESSVASFLQILEDGKTKWYIREGKINPGSVNIVELFKKMKSRF